MPFGAKTVPDYVKEISDNAGTDLDTTNNASFKRDSEASLKAIAEPLKANKSIKKVTLVDCDITDQGCAVLKDILMGNHTIEELNLEKNKISSEGAKLLAEGLSKNYGLRTLNLLQQAVKAFGDDCLSEYLAMYETNITLTKVTWRLDSRKSFALNKFETRNTQIRKRVDNGSDYTSFLPDSMKASPPDLTKSGDEIAKQIASGSGGYVPPAAAAPAAAEPAAAAPEPAAAEPEPAAAEPEPAAAEPEPRASTPEPVSETAPPPEPVPECTVAPEEPAAAEGGADAEEEGESATK